MSGVDRAKHFVHGVFKDAAERVLPVRKESGFRKEGVLTPEEFVAAGDFLVGACPTWRWEAGEAAKARPYLPSGKQYLVTRNVPCLRRAAAFAESGDAMPEEEVEGEEGWLATGEAGGAGPSGDADAVDMSLEAGPPGGGAAEARTAGATATTSQTWRTLRKRTERRTLRLRPPPPPRPSQGPAPTMTTASCVPAPTTSRSPTTNTTRPPGSGSWSTLRTAPSSSRRSPSRM